MSECSWGLRQMSPPEPIDGLARALVASNGLIATVREDQWSNPSPCPEFNARALVNHLVFCSRVFAGILVGEPPPSVEELTRQRAVDHLGVDPLTAHRDAGAALLAAFRDPNVLERRFWSPVGTVPGAVLLRLRIAEELVHGWDIAQATGQLPRLPEDLAEDELAFSRGQLDGNIPRTYRFGEAQPVADDAAAIDRLAAFL